MKTIKIEWTETSHHSRTVNVPDDFDHEEADLENELAQLDDEGFEWLERTVESVEDVEFQPDAEVFA
ncbi:hypothetical protein [Rhodococcoides fascians]|uniref:hypothetical protein n=1 Tax=Rhodococcoides fascians TaxID=1828 RepID=UPI00050BEDEE|nr:hypothetical protein [Rhodococcus fascians]